MTKRSRLLIGVLAVLSVVLSHFLTKSVGFSKSSLVTFSLGPTGEFLQSSTTLVVATRLDNTSDRNAFEVHIESISLNSALLLSPSLPLLVGEIDAGQSATVQATFDSSQLVQGTPYELVVHGSYRPVNKGTSDDEGHEFTMSDVLQLPPVAPGSAPLMKTTVGPNTVSGGGFPHLPPHFPDKANMQRWLAPTGPFVAVKPTPTGTSLQLAKKSAKASSGDPAVTFNVNNGMGLTSNISGTAEPSGGVSGGGVILAAANWTAAYSTDGVTFTQVDPTTVFPNDAVGYCCDQIVQYVPSIDRFVWLLQGNGYRLAVASPADVVSSGGTAWTYWNLTPSVFGQPSENFDYPDLSVGDNFLYISWDAGGPSGCDCGHQVARTSLAGLQAGGTIEIDFTDPANGGSSWGAKLVQDTGNEIFWAGQDSNSQMRIFSLMEGSGTYFWQTVGISTWANNSPLSSLTPDSQNWINFLFNPTSQNPGDGFPANAAIGGTRVGNQVWFAWSAGTDSNFPQPHVEMVTLNIDNNNPPNLSVNQQVQIWNPNFAFAYPALATNACTGEVGLSLELGGGGNYENHAVGFWGDFVVYVTSASTVGSTRFGDYVTLRQDFTAGNNGAFFDAFGYGLNSSGSGTQTDVRYVQFGRGGSCSITSPK